MNTWNLDTEVSADLISQAVSWRQYLHKHPELAFRETETADFVANKLATFGFEVHRGLGGTGVVGTLRRGSSPRVVGIRADMDALPIQEQGARPYASSVRGVMHACGHDGHVAIALAAAKACSTMQSLEGTVRFIFQPAEEAECGAKRMVDEGLFTLFPCDAIYAMHNWPALPLGTFVARDGPMLAALGVFEITVSGIGCHGALPHEGTDAILATCQIVSSLQSIVSRNIDPRDAAVVSVTEIKGGDSWNIIPDKCAIRGTTRWFTAMVGDALERRMREVAGSIAAAFGCQVTVHYERRFPITINSPREAAVLRKVADSPPLQLSLVDAPPSTGSEDFAFMLQSVPGCYVLLGSARNAGNASLHSAQFDFNDELIPVGVKLWIAVIRNHLGQI